MKCEITYFEEAGYKNTEEALKFSLTCISSTISMYFSTTTTLTCMTIIKVSFIKLRLKMFLTVIPDDGRPYRRQGARFI